jgi:hypothetical protein
VRPVLYTYVAFAEAHLNLKTLAGYGLWIADYGPNDARDHGTRLPNIEHQFTSRGVVSGIIGHSDMNFAPSLTPLLITKVRPSPPPVPTTPGPRTPSPPAPQGEPKNRAPFKRLWPVPVPAWFWTWAQWRQDGQSYARPADAPALIPPWAWVRLRAL